MSSEIFDWFAFFKEVFEDSKEKLREHYKLEADGSGPPCLVSYNKAVESLPCGVKVLEFKINEKRFKKIEDDIIQWIQFDLSILRKLEVEYLGSVKLSNATRILEILITKFGFSKSYAETLFGDYLREGRTLRAAADTDKLFYLIITTNDIKEQKSEFIKEFILDFTFSLGDIIVRQLGLPLERYLKYKLPPERVLPFEELIKRDSPNYPTTSIERLQEQISEIHLVDTVPEHVTRTFKNAKELFKFGYFRYNFFTISRHYACLALEAAVKHKYSQCLPKHVELHYKKGDRRYPMGNPDYDKILDFCREKRRGLHPAGIYVNGKKFPYSRHELVAWLLGNTSINLYESKLCELYLKERNWLSHLFFAPVDTPSTIPLTNIANLINTMFGAQNENAKNL